MKSGFIKVNKKNPCKICGKPDWCMVSRDGVVSRCNRIEKGSSRKTPQGGNLFFDDDSPTPNKPKRKIQPIAPVQTNAVSRSLAEIDTVYRAFLDELVLAFAHEKELRRRGLDEFGIILGGYKSMPTKIYSQAVCKRLIKQGLNLSGVPGFYTDRAGNWHFVDYRNATGFLIPIKDELGSIKALQLRRDDDQKPKYLLISSVNFPNGTTCGTPFHVNRNYPAKNKIFTEVIITEGILKANVIAEFQRVPVVGLVSAATFSDSFVPDLLKVFPNLKKCVIAFDMDEFDPKNPNNCAFVHVGRQRDRLVEQLEKHSLRVSIKTWDGGFKGYDDFLNASKNYAIAA